MTSSWRWRFLAGVLCCLWSAAALAGEGMEAAEPPPPETPPEPVEVEVRPAPEGLPSLQMSPDFTAPGLAFGGYFPVPQMESGAIRIEPFTIRAAVNAGLGYDDNVTLSSTNKISSMFFTVVPSVVVGLEGATQRYYAIYRGSYGRFSSSAIDDYENHNFGLTGANDWTARLRSRAAYEFTRGHDPRGTTGTAVAEPDVWNLHRLRGSVSYGADGAPARIEGNAGYLSREYTTNRALTAGRDYEQFDVGATFSYRIAPKTRGLVQIGHTEITHNLDPLLDASENRYLVGVTWDALAKTQGAVRVGYLTRDASNPATPNFSAATYEASATWSPLTYSILNFTATRTSAEASEAGSNFIVVDVASVVWNHAWFDRVRSTIGYLYGQQNHEGLGRTDTYQTLNARVSYAIHRRVRLGAEFRHDARNSPDPAFEYKRNLTLFTIESSL